MAAVMVAAETVEGEAAIDRPGTDEGAGPQPCGAPWNAEASDGITAGFDVHASFAAPFQVTLP